MHLKQKRKETFMTGKEGRRERREREGGRGRGRG